MATYHKKYFMHSQITFDLSRDRNPFDIFGYKNERIEQTNIDALILNPNLIVKRGFRIQIINNWILDYKLASFYLSILNFIYLFIFHESKF